MAASDHLHPGQLRMFMPAHELINTPSVDIHARSTFKSHEDLYAHKRRDNAADGLAAHVAEHGVHAPVTLATGDEYGDTYRVSDGHHRIAAAYDADPNMEVPVQYQNYDYGHRYRLSGAAEDAAYNQSTPGWKPTDRFPSLP